MVSCKRGNENTHFCEPRGGRITTPLSGCAWEFHNITGSSNFKRNSALCLFSLTLISLRKSSLIIFKMECHDRQCGRVVYARRSDIYAFI